MMEHQNKHFWQAKEYFCNSSAQSVGAFQLLKRIPLSGHEKILDVGCGDGKITAEIATYLPYGTALGIDFSPEMINFAQHQFNKKSYPNLTYLIKDAQKLDYVSDFDIIFSSFALQWLQNPFLFFEGAYRGLKPQGLLAITIPLGISAPLYESINHIISLPEWASYFHTFCPDWHFKTSEEYSNFLSIQQFKIHYFEVLEQLTTFDSRDSFENYVIQWLTYLNPLPLHLKSIFFKKVIDRYLDSEPENKNGEVYFRFPRIDIIAEKSIINFKIS